MNMKNDLSFMIANTINLYEHQSTYSKRAMQMVSEEVKRVVDRLR